MKNKNSPQWSWILIRKTTLIRLPALLELLLFVCFKLAGLNLSLFFLIKVDLFSFHIKTNQCINWIMLYAILAYICSHFENDALAMSSYSSVIPECLLLWDYCKTALIHTVKQGDVIPTQQAGKKYSQLHIFILGLFWSRFAWFS